MGSPVALIKKRNRLVREVYDTLAQELAGIALQLATGTRIEVELPPDGYAGACEPGSLGLERQGHTWPSVRRDML